MMYASDIRPVTDTILTKYGLNGPRKSYYCDKAPSLSHGYHQVCVDNEAQPWFYCTCTCHRGRITVTVEPADVNPTPAINKETNRMASIYAIFEVDAEGNPSPIIRCREHLTGIRPKAGRPPQTIEVDGERWTYVNPKSEPGVAFLKCEACETLESV